MLEIEPIAYIHTEFKEKFGIPRQSGLVNELKGYIEFTPEYSKPEAVKNLEEFSHIWIIWEFSENTGRKWTPTVRPPRLGGNKRTGVFATRSPFRPNPLGLSVVKMEKIEYEKDHGLRIYISGVDMLDNTPVYDIKPYLPYVECITNAKGGFTDATRDYELKVVIPENIKSEFSEETIKKLIGILKNDPRPSYQNDPMRVYGLTFADFNVKFKVEYNTVKVIDIEEHKKEVE